MLEFTYYNTKNIYKEKDFFIVSFVLIDDVYNKIIPTSIINRSNIFKSNLYDFDLTATNIDDRDAVFELIESNHSIKALSYNLSFILNIINLGQIKHLIFG